MLYDSNRQLSNFASSLPLSEPTAIKGWGGNSQDAVTMMYLRGLCAHYNVDIDTRIDKLPKDFYNILLYGSGDEKIKYRHETCALLSPYSAISRFLILRIFLLIRLISTVKVSNRSCIVIPPHLLKYQQV